MYTGQFLRLGVGGRTGYTTKKRLLLRSLSTFKSQKSKPFHYFSP